MKICIDAREARQVQTGLARYTLNLIRHIAELDRQNEYILLRRASYPGPLVVQDNFTEIPVPYGISTFRNILTGAGVVNPVRADIYHALFHLLPFGVRAKHVVVTLHDLIWVNQPGISYDVRWRRMFAHRVVAPLIGRAVESADHIIAISDSTRRDALARYALPASRFTVIHHGIDAALASSAHAAALPAACAGKSFVFSLGNTRPYKNVPRLIRAFRAVVAQHPDLLLVVSGRGDGYPSLFHLARELDISQNVLFMSQLSDAEVRACFTHALCFAFPSLAEGFGIPVIEAMANGCPVLTSATSSFPEIVGDAAVLTDPMDIESIASGLLRLVENETLRRDLALRGRQRAARYSWQACAQQTLAVYRKLMGRGDDPPASGAV